MHMLPAGKTVSVPDQVLNHPDNLPIIKAGLRSGRIMEIEMEDKFTREWVRTTSFEELSELANELGFSESDIESLGEDGLRAGVENVLFVDL